MFQVCSAVHNQEHTVIEDYVTGLKTLLYLRSVEELHNWDGQSPPTAPHQLGKPVLKVKDIIEENLPSFGPYLAKRQELKDSLYKEKDLLSEENMPEPQRPANAPKKPRVKDVIGLALSRIGTYGDLNNQEQVVALIDELKVFHFSMFCICVFIAKFHNRTSYGCTLCLSVCPIIDCISMVPRTTPYIPKRGIPLGTGNNLLPGVSMVTN
uniref:4Fe-4S ferredoxin-type domain-containing protein n=1 Tax=Magallana gigas TaxID=29159 RepID=A0A8W8J0L6_MAGGI